MVPTPVIQILISGAVVFLAFVTNVILMMSLRRYRIDIGPKQSMGEGKSKVWQRNVFNSLNYDGDGRRRLRWCYVAIAVQMLAFFRFGVVLAAWQMQLHATP